MSSFKQPLRYRRMRSRIPTLLHNIYDQSTSLSLYRLPVAPSERGTKETTHETHDPSQSRDSLTLPRSLHRGPSFAAQPSATDAATHASTAKSNVATRPAMKCLGDLRDFNSQMSKDGHWLGASRYGYGYPMDGLGYRYPMRGRGAMHGDRAATDNGYMSARLVTRCERSSRRPTFSPGMARNSHARMCLPSRVLSTKPMWPIFKTAKRQQTYLTGGSSRSPRRSPSPATARLSDRTN
jgi:hypothetical protein